MDKPRLCPTCKNSFDKEEFYSSAMYAMCTCMKCKKVYDFDLYTETSKRNYKEESVLLNKLIDEHRAVIELYEKRLKRLDIYNTANQESAHTFNEYELQLMRKIACTMPLSDVAKIFKISEEYCLYLTKPKKLDKEYEYSDHM